MQVFDTYLYRHIRNDKNEVFYVGIGKARNYNRATSKACRNKHWKNIVACTDYTVEIIMDNLTQEEAEKKEKEFISIYGRIDQNTGTLVNLTNGGYGYCYKAKDKKNQKTVEKRISHRLGKKATEDSKLKMSAAQKGNKTWLGKNHTIESKIKIGLSSKGRVGYWKGKKLSLSTKNKLSESKLGVKMKEEHRIKVCERMKGVGNPMFGRKHSEETKAKISKTKLLKRANIL